MQHFRQVISNEVRGSKTKNHISPPVPFPFPSLPAWLSRIVAQPLYMFPPPSKGYYEGDTRGSTVRYPVRRCTRHEYCTFPQNRAGAHAHSPLSSRDPDTPTRDNPPACIPSCPWSALALALAMTHRHRHRRRRFETAQLRRPGRHGVLVIKCCWQPGWRGGARSSCARGAWFLQCRP